jgi:Fe2+ or Zn2+ uptake regulation protein
MRMIRNRMQSNQTKAYVLTPQRQLILELIRKSYGHLDAKKLYQLVSKKDATVSLATVYRSLALFKQVGLIDEHRLNKTRCCYELKQSLDHQHMLCKACGNIFEFESPLITELIKTIQDKEGFIIEKVELCLQGTCSQCQQDNISGAK